MIQLPGVGIQVVILMKPVGRTVILVCTTVANQSDLAARGAAEGSIGVCDADAELVDSIYTDGDDGSLVRAASDDVIGNIDTV